MNASAVLGAGASMGGGMGVASMGAKVGVGAGLPPHWQAAVAELPENPDIEGSRVRVAVLVRALRWKVVVARRALVDELHEDGSVQHA